MSIEENFTLDAEFEDYYHWSELSIDAEELLTKAWAAVKASGVPEPLYELAFKEALGLIFVASEPQKASNAELPMKQPPSEGKPGSADPEANSSTDLIDEFARESGIPVDELVDVFYFDAEGLPHLNVAGRKLGESGISKSKAIATAIVAAYHFSRDDSQISVEIVRAECERLKSYDKKNFWTHMASAPATVLSGSGSSRVLKVKSGEIAAALRAVVNTARGTKE